MEYIAHSSNEEGNEQPLAAHLIGVAEIMEKFAPNEMLRKVFRTTGLIHDIGKYQNEFQRYIKEGGVRGSVPHANIGAAYCRVLKQQEAAFVVDGHHKGIPDLAELQTDIASFKNREKELKEISERFLSEIFIEESELTLKNSLGLEGTKREFIIRYLFSALTDADWIDTEKHFNKTQAESRICKPLDTLYLIGKIEKEIDQKDKESPINKLRNEVRKYAISRATGNVGFYSMNLPTGLGKTLASVSWALHHARQNNLRRIIIVLPFISIIDQTASDLKKIFGEEWVLEHHSSYTDNKESDDKIKNETVQGIDYTKRLAAENWDFPVIVTTSVQFFESLFANKPSKCRKVHNIAQSVVIFDEVQTLPKKLVIPTLTMLKDVQRVMNTSFLFCTATQPAFEKREGFEGIDSIEPLVQNPKSIFEKCRRVEYIPVNEYKPVKMDELAELVSKQDSSCLCIFNTKAKAFSFFEAIRSLSGYRKFHLSTRMYPVHRKRVIKQIREALSVNEKIIVASTQLIEAGVDFDFPCVFREIAPLESIIQSAGRCNRNNTLPHKGKVYLFTLEDPAAPDKQYRSLAEFANTMYANQEDLLHEHDFFTQYYQKALRLFFDEDREKINESRNAFKFHKVADCYRLIDNKTIPVFVLCEETKPLYETIRHKPVLSREDFRKMQLYSVQVYENFLKENIGKLGKEPQGFWVWHGEYNEETGITGEMKNYVI